MLDIIHEYVVNKPFKRPYLNILYKDPCIIRNGSIYANKKFIYIFSVEILNYIENVNHITEKKLYTYIDNKWDDSEYIIKCIKKM
tara:strand:- start:27 stop:281 length:255 start_codon:yes stop_codon:yes gene_type:complete